MGVNQAQRGARAARKAEAPRARSWHIAPGKVWTLDRPRLLGILNVTPDSFFDGGRHDDAARAVAAGLAMLAEGADGLDIGGESTRPGSAPVAPRAQVRRVVPVIRALRARAGGDVVITIDTTSALVARAALDAGADAINDTSGGEDDPAIRTLAAERACGLILMHRLRRPQDDTFSDRYGRAVRAPRYGDVVRSVRAALARLAARALRAGVARACIVIDPGLGFGKTVEQNLDLIRRTPELGALGYPILSGLSRKSFVGRAMTPAGEEPPPPEGRLAGTLALSLAHARLGAMLLRVHDVRAHAALLRAAR